MRPHVHAVRLLLGLAFLAAASLHLAAQAYRVRPIGRPRPADTFIDSLMIQASPGFVNFALVSGGVAQGSSGVTVTSTWTSHGNPPQLAVYGYFTSASSALSDGKNPAHLIPSSAVLGQVTTGVPVAYTPFTQTNTFGAAGASLLLVSTPNGQLAHGGSRTDVLNLEIDLSGVPNLPAGTYSGTLTLQAQMF